MLFPEKTRGGYGCLKVLEDMFIDPYCDRVESEFLAPNEVDLVYED